MIKDVEIKQYGPEHKDGCLSVFRSNLDPYFDDSELDGFVHYLDSRPEGTRYYVVLEGNRVVACGGYGLEQGRLSLDWGMVDRALHRSGLGALLLMHRLDKIKQEYGDTDVCIDTSQHTEGFFKKYGFYTTAVVQDGFGEGLHKVCMVLSST